LESDLRERRLEEIAMVSRFAFLILSLSQGEVVEKIRGVIAQEGIGLAGEMLRSFGHCRGLMETLDELIETGQTRFAVSMAHVLAAKDDTPPVH
jgi:hypothetical protein